MLIVGTYHEDGSPNAMNAAWGGIYEADEVVLCLSEGHQSTANIKNRKAFTIAIADTVHVVQADYVGIVSAHQVPNKLERAGFHTTKSAFVDAPVIDELPLALECRLVKVTEDGNIIGEIVNASADERVLGEDGLIDPAKLRAIVFDPVRSTYLELDKQVGTAFSDGAALK